MVARGRVRPAKADNSIAYAIGIAVVQVGWLLTLVVPASMFTMVFFLLVLAELAVPVLAERGAMTTVHPHHIAERYGLSR